MSPTRDKGDVADGKRDQREGIQVTCPHCGSTDWYELEDERSRCVSCFATHAKPKVDARVGPRFRPTPVEPGSGWTVVPTEGGESRATTRVEKASNLVNQTNRGEPMTEEEHVHQETQQDEHTTEDGKVTQTEQTTTEVEESKDKDDE